jgi:gas vesicle protein
MGTYWIIQLKFYFMKNENTNAKLIGALVVGAVIGGALGILFAPEKGSETRKKIAGRTDDLAKGMKEKVREFSENGTL